MRKMKPYAAALAVFTAAALALLPVAPAMGQGTNLRGILIEPFRAISAADVITAVSTDVGIYVKYIGTASGAATVTVDAATGDIAFVSAGAADTTVDPTANCAGGVANSLDVSDTDCDTVQEVIDHINSSSSWRAAPGSMLLTDSTNNTLITLAATDAKGPNGLGLLKDTVVALNVTLSVLPSSNGGRSLGISNWLSPLQSRARFAENPFADTDTIVLYASENVTSSGAVGSFSVFCAVPKFSQAPTAQKLTETVQTLYFEAGAATTVTGIINEFINAGGVPPCNGGRVLVRIVATTDLTAPSVIATGYTKSRAAGTF